MRVQSRFIVLILGLLLAIPALAQNPTGTLSGRVIDVDGGVLPGVLVTASSPSLQGTRTTFTASGGDYLFRFLPPGDYEITYELEGFSTARRDSKISAAQSLELDVTLQLSTVAEEIVVTGAFETVSTKSQASTTYEKVFIEQLPVNRDIESAVVLTPGVSQTGPNDNIVISGAQSYENLFLVNGVVVNENLRGQPFDLFIEDAIQETTTSTSGISAEYGRFAGGVVNVITKSGGNQFEGSFRTNLSNEDWQALRPGEINQTDKINQVYEATLGGYLWRDKLWFFLAGRDFSDSATAQTTLTNIPYPDNDEQQRLEGKLTFSPAEGHRIVGSYMEIDETNGGVIFSSVLDLASVYDRKEPQDLLALNYTGVLTPSFFVEAQYSERHFTFVDSGAPFTDRIRGTLFVDRQTGNRWHSPTFCGVCEPDEERNNENYLLKGSWFLSSEKTGSHDIVFGYDYFNDIRLADNHQSGSDFRILISGTVVDPDGVTLYPIYRSGTSGSASIIQWNPILEGSQGTDFITKSYFVNDVWRLSNRLTFNLGLRYDVNDGRDAANKKVIDDAKLSPRFGATFDLKGDGDWLFNASYAEYVTAIANSQGSASSSAGSPATITWWYQGPSINTGGAPFVGADAALQTLWDWFDSTGNTNNPNTRSLSIPGGTTQIRDTLASPSTLEYTVGVSKRLGNRGVVRVDYVRREGTDFYVDRRDLSTGIVTLANGSRADLSIVENNDSLLSRTYDGLHTSFRFRVLDRLNLGGNWTWSHLRGNVDGETRNSGPVRSDILDYPEYFDVDWSAPKGDLSADQRNRVRLWATYDILDTAHNDLNISVLQSYFSGRPYEAVGGVDTRPNVTNPGYVRPPTAVTYFYSGRGAFTTEDVYATDLAVNYSFKWNIFGREIDVFLQPEVLNIFNRQGITTTDSRFFNADVFDATNTGSTSCGGNPCQTFNPFAETPVEGVHWAKDPAFGTADSPSAYQTPRTFRVSLGFRF